MEIDKEKLLDKIKYLLKNFKASGLLILFFFTIIYFQELAPFTLLFAGISSLSIFFFILLFSRVRIKVVKHLFTCLLASFIAVDAVCSIFFGTRVNENIIGAITESNIGEASGMLGGIIIPAALIAILTFTLLIGSVREFVKVKHSLVKSTSIYAVFLIGISGTPFANHAVHSYFEYNEDSGKCTFNKDLFHHLFFELRSHTITNIYSAQMTILYTDIIGIVYNIRERHTYRNYYLTNRKIPTGMHLNTSSTEKIANKIFLVIGESASSKHMSLYKYPISTTPWMDEMEADTLSNTKLYHYSAITSHITTRIAVPQILTAENLMTGPEYLTHFKNLIELGNDANYETIWISNQSMLGPYEGLIPLIASHAIHKIYNSPNISSHKTHYEDLELLPIITEYIDYNKNQLFIIHLEGSHRDFTKRYDDLDKQLIKGEGSVTNYDRTIHHTDRLLKKIYKQMPDNSVMLYTSDHGENPISSKGRYDLEAGSYPYHVPLVLVDNNTDINSNKIILSYYNDDARIINNSNIYYIVSEIMGYKVKQSTKETLKEQSQYLYIESMNKALTSMNEDRNRNEK